MQLNFTPFHDWLTCQYPYSSARKHYLSDLALFFSWTGKPPTEISPQGVNRYIHCCLEKNHSLLLRSTVAFPCGFQIFHSDN